MITVWVFIAPNQLTWRENGLWERIGTGTQIHMDLTVMVYAFWTSMPRLLHSALAFDIAPKSMV